MRVTVSSCLLGIDCRYCGDGYPQEGILKLIKDGLNELAAFW